MHAYDARVGAGNQSRELRYITEAKWIPRTNIDPGCRVGKFREQEDIKLFKEKRGTMC